MNLVESFKALGSNRRILSEEHLKVVHGYSFRILVSILGSLYAVLGDEREGRMSL
jgi:hypothetical protein